MKALHMKFCTETEISKSPEDDEKRNEGEPVVPTPKPNVCSIVLFLQKTVITIFLNEQTYVSE